MTVNGNLVLGTHDDEVFISYNECVRAGRLGSDFGPLCDIADMISGADNESGEETALLIDDVWYILQGDFRKEYEAVYPYKDKCMAIYDKHKAKHRSNSSTDNLII